MMNAAVVKYHGVAVGMGIAAKKNRLQKARNGVAEQTR